LVGGSIEKVEMTVGELLCMQEPNFYRGRILNSYEDGANASVCSGFMLKNDKFSE
jgi:hypothetical protein